MTCQWCGEPAVVKILMEPAQYRAVTKTSPEGERYTAHEVARFAVYADACAKHRSVRDNLPGEPIWDPRRRKASGVEQTTIFDVPGVADGPADALTGG